MSFQMSWWKNKEEKRNPENLFGNGDISSADLKVHISDKIGRVTVKVSGSCCLVDFSGKISPKIRQLTLAPKVVWMMSLPVNDECRMAC